ncbi:hypothetical protein BJX70DRAFT_370705, partial [Aspergillus crustosus]
IRIYWDKLHGKINTLIYVLYILNTLVYMLCLKLCFYMCKMHTKDLEAWLASIGIE